METVQFILSVIILIILYRIAGYTLLKVLKLDKLTDVTGVVGFTASYFVFFILAIIFFFVDLPFTVLAIAWALICLIGVAAGIYFGKVRTTFKGIKSFPYLLGMMIVVLITYYFTRSLEDYAMETGFALSMQKIMEKNTIKDIDLFSGYSNFRVICKLYYFDIYETVISKITGISPFIIKRCTFNCLKIYFFMEILFGFGIHLLPHGVKAITKKKRETSYFFTMIAVLISVIFYNSGALSYSIGECLLGLTSGPEVFGRLVAFPLLIFLLLYGRKHVSLGMIILAIITVVSAVAICPMAMPHIIIMLIMFVMVMILDPYINKIPVIKIALLSIYLLVSLITAIIFSGEGKIMTGYRDVYGEIYSDNSVVIIVIAMMAIYLTFKQSKVIVRVLGSYSILISLILMNPLMTSVFKTDFAARIWWMIPYEFVAGYGIWKICKLCNAGIKKGVDTNAKLEIRNGVIISIMMVACLCQVFNGHSFINYATLEPNKRSICTYDSRMLELVNFIKKDCKELGNDKPTVFASRALMDTIHLLAPEINIAYEKEINEVYLKNDLEKIRDEYIYHDMGYLLVGAFEINQDPDTMMEKIREVHTDYIILENRDWEEEYFPKMGCDISYVTKDKRMCVVHVLYY